MAEDEVILRGRLAQFITAQFPYPIELGLHIRWAGHNVSNACLALHIKNDVVSDTFRFGWLSINITPSKIASFTNPNACTCKNENIVGEHDAVADDGT